jgi:N-acyl-D-aspartate/D-glutamate deacylase
MPHDLVIRNGTIIDGTGAERHGGDIAIDGDRLTQVGGQAGAGTRELDADGLVVSPGFIDPHTHYDAQICWDRALTPSCWNGITSCVMGNCGFTLAPCHADDVDRDRIMRMLERVEGMSLEAMRAGIDWAWETFPEYLDHLGAIEPALNVGSLVGHSAVRYFVLGPDAAQREASPAEIERMRELVREAMRAGALGFSTSQAPTHIGGDGRPVPSRFAADDEVFALGEVLAEFDHGALELVTKDLTDVEVSIELARRSGRPVTFLGATPRAGLARLDEARAEGLALVPQTSCRPTLMDFRLGGMGLFDQLPSWQRAAAAAGEALKAVFRDPAFREAFRKDTGPEFPGFRLFGGDYDGIKILVTDREDMRHLIGRSVADVATERGSDPLDTLFDLALEDELGMQFSYCVSTDLTREPSLIDDNFLIGLSDAGAHLTLLADHAYTTYFLGRWIRERKLMPLENAVRKLTQVPAQLFGIPERGVLREGWHADVVLFDPNRVIDRETELVYDLPGGGPRLLTRADGIEQVIVNGEVTVERGEWTGAHAGQVLRGA